MIEVSEYLLQPLRVLYDACRQSGQDDGGRRCPTCAVRDVCDAEVARRQAMYPVQHRQHSRKALPPAGISWGVRKKEAVITAIRLGIIAREDAYARYLLSPAELAAWEAAYDQGGRRALSGKAAARRRAVSLQHP